MPLGITRLDLAFDGALTRGPEAWTNAGFFESERMNQELLTNVSNKISGRLTDWIVAEGQATVIYKPRFLLPLTVSFHRITQWVGGLVVAGSTS